MQKIKMEQKRICTVRVKPGNECGVNVCEGKLKITFDVPTEVTFFDGRTQRCLPGQTLEFIFTGHSVEVRNG